MASRVTSVALPPQKQFQQGCLTQRQHQWCLAHFCLPGNRIEDELAQIEHNAQCCVRPSQQRAHAGDQFRHMEWLDQIVISAGIEAGYPVVRCISRRQDSTGIMFPRRRKACSNVSPSPSTRPRSRIIAS